MWNKSSSSSVPLVVGQVVKEYTFLDYIMGGCQINFTVSNRAPLLRRPSTLPCLDPALMDTLAFAGGYRLHRVQR